MRSLPRPQRIGQAGEERAASWYRARGFRIVDRNWQTPGGEIDLVCASGPLLVFCEVKTRLSAGCGTPAEAVTGAKARRVRRAAARWLVAHRGFYPDVRFDVACITPGQVQVIEGAF